MWLCFSFKSGYRSKTSKIDCLCGCGWSGGFAARIIQRPSYYRSISFSSHWRFQEYTVSTQNINSASIHFPVLPNQAFRSFSALQ